MREGWNLSQLSSLVERVNTKNRNGIDRVLTLSAEHGLIEQELFFNKRVASTSLTNYTLVEPGTFVYSKSYSQAAPVGVITRNRGPEPGVVSPIYIAFRPTSDQLVDGYLDLAVTSKVFADSLRRVMKEGGRAHGGINISLADFFALPIPVPPAQEQRRIVDLIASIDVAIDSAASLSATVDPLWTAAVGQATAGARLVKLGTAMNVVRAGGTPSRKTKGFFGGDVPWLKSGEVNNPSIRRSEESISTEALAQSSAWLVPEGAVLVAMYGATAGAVGYLEMPMATNQAVLALIGEPSKTDQRFLYHWLRSRRSIMKSRATGATQPNLSKKRVLEELIPSLPVERQREMAELLDRTLKVETESVRWIARTKTVRGQILSSLLSGDHEIPDSYDRFLEAAS
jgi:type I restriction enzyme, S subunit